MRNSAEEEEEEENMDKKGKEREIQKKTNGYIKLQTHTKKTA